MDYPEGTIIDTTGKAPLLYVGQCQAVGRKLNSISLYLQGGKNPKQRRLALLPGHTFRIICLGVQFGGKSTLGFSFQN